MSYDDPTYHALHFRKAALPADVDKPRCNDDNTHRANNHQDDKQFAVVTPCLAGSGVTRAHAGEVLNADLKCDFHYQDLITETHLVKRAICKYRLSASTSFNPLLTSPSIDSTSLVAMTPNGMKERMLYLTFN